MEFLIFSDSHGETQGMKHALSRQLTAPDGVFFLGDGLRDLDALEFSDRTTLYRVAGNCDWFSSSMAPTECTTALGGHVLFLTHGHRFGVKGGFGALLAHAATVGADIVLCGHTHRQHAEIIPAGQTVAGVLLTRPMYLFNPGSIGHDVDGEGRSFGTLLIKGESVLFSHGRI